MTPAAVGYTPGAKILARISKPDGEAGCWPWVGAFREDGYGTFRVNGRVERAHRLVYELLRGPIPDRLVIDHLCRNHACVNPSHLEPVTAVENVMRGVGPFASRARQTHCKRGHAFDEANTYVTPKGTRDCKECKRGASRKAYAKRALAKKTDSTRG